MHIPACFAETRIDVMHTLIRAQPLATVVVHGALGLDAHHIPMHLDATNGDFGVLQGHVNRANSIWRTLGEGTEALMIFHGPQTYITPSWYATKKETEKVVPTWNYVSVHAHGRLRAIDDPSWLRQHLARLVADNEAHEIAPWKISDAPVDYIDTLLRGIVGIEMTITRLSGQWKVSQNHPAANRAGVVEGLRQRSSADAQSMAELIGQRGAS